MLVVPSLQGGGAERVAKNLLDNLNKTQDIILCLFGKNHSQKLPKNIKVRCLPVKSSKNVLYTVAKFFLIIFHVRKIIKEEKPNSILSFMDYPNIVSIISNYLAGRKARVNISIHTVPELHLKKYSNSKWNASISMLMKLLYNRADKIIAVSNFIKSDLIRGYNIEESRVMVIYNPVNIEKIDALASEEISDQWFREEVPVVISVGRLSKEKGYDTLLRAFAIAREKSDIRLAILGEGEEKKSLEELGRKLGIERDIVFLGYKNNPYKYMKRASIFVLSSLYEGFPNVLIEAMACGVPLISTMYNLCPSEIIVHEKTGLLVPVANEKAFAEAILRLLKDEKLRRSLAEGARKKVADFSIDVIADKYKTALGI